MAIAESNNLDIDSLAWIESIKMHVIFENDGLVYILNG